MYANTYMHEIIIGKKEAINFRIMIRGLEDDLWGRKWRKKDVIKISS